MTSLKQHTTPTADYLDNPANTKVLSYQYPYPPNVIWNALVDADTWGKWVNGIEKVTWTSPEPFQKGTTRTVEGGKNVIEEVFFKWEDNAEMAFYFDRSNLPIKGFAESYALKATPSGCELIWTFRTEANPILKWLINTMMARNGKKGFPILDKYIRDNPKKFGLNLA